MFSNLEQGFILALLGVIAYSVFRMQFDLMHMQRQQFKQGLANERFLANIATAIRELRDEWNREDVIITGQDESTFATNRATVDDDASAGTATATVEPVKVSASYSAPDTFGVTSPDQCDHRQALKLARDMDNGELVKCPTCGESYRVHFDGQNRCLVWVGHEH